MKTIIMLLLLIPSMVYAGKGDIEFSFTLEKQPDGVYLIEPVEEQKIMLASIDLDALSHAESNNNTFAKSNANGIGCWQITAICLQDYNQARPRTERFKIRDMYIRDYAEQVAQWTIEYQIPRYLKHYDIEVNDYNVLWCWHDGIGNVRRQHRSNGAQVLWERYQMFRGDV